MLMAQGIISITLFFFSNRRKALRLLHYVSPLRVQRKNFCACWSASRWDPKNYIKIFSSATFKCSTKTVPFWYCKSKCSFVSDGSTPKNYIGLLMAADLISSI